MASVVLERAEPTAGELRLVVVASSLGTVFEWYDFFVYGTLAPLFGQLFFPSGNETAAFLLSLATFGAGFIVRPFGALFFGALGDIVGRKYTFLVTIALMGVATAGIGFLPTYGAIGLGAPILLVSLRLIQGLAIGGEYGGAATYVAEHAPPKRRGYFTSYIQATATIGLFLSLAVVAACRLSLSEEAFRDWGWRIPFLISLILLAISLYIRARLHESPVFAAMKAEGRTAKNPIRESFTRWGNLKFVLMAFFGACIGQSVLWYTANFYAMLFMQNALGVDYLHAYELVAVALVVGMVMVVFCGWLSDRVGRKWVMMTAWLLGALTLQPLFATLAEAVNPALMAANRDHPVTVTADPSQCGVVVFASPDTACQKLRALLSTGGVQFVAAGKGGDALSLSIPGLTLSDVHRVDQSGTTTDWDQGIKETLTIRPDGSSVLSYKILDGPIPETQIRAALKLAGYPEKADPAQINWPLAILVLSAIVTLGAIGYGPIAAFLVELFPTRIRYTSLSLPYNIANGLIGGFQPFVSFAIITATGNIFAGVWYPMAVAATACVVGSLLLPETRGRDLEADETA